MKAGKIWLVIGGASHDRRDYNFEWSDEDSSFKIRSDMQRVMLQCVDQVVEGAGNLWKLMGLLSAFKLWKTACFSSCSKDESRCD